MAHNTPEQNDAFRKAWDATNARWKAQQKTYEKEQEEKKLPGFDQNPLDNFPTIWSKT
jgi:hypothetical protein